MKLVLLFLLMIISSSSFALVVSNQPICERPSRKALVEFEVSLNDQSHKIFQDRIESFFNKICWDEIEPKMLVDKLFQECSNMASSEKEGGDLNTPAEFQARCETLKTHAITLLRGSDIAKKNKCEKKEEAFTNLDKFLEK